MQNKVELSGTTQNHEEPHKPRRTSTYLSRSYAKLKIEKYVQKYAKLWVKLCYLISRKYSILSNIHICTSAHTLTLMSTHARMCMYMHTYTDLCTHVYGCGHKCMPADAYKSLRTPVHAMHKFKCPRMSMYACARLRQNKHKRKIACQCMPVNAYVHIQRSVHARARACPRTPAHELPHMPAHLHSLIGTHNNKTIMFMHAWNAYIRLRMPEHTCVRTRTPAHARARPHTPSKHNWLTGTHNNTKMS